MNVSDLTFVTAADPKYVVKLATTFPTWIRNKELDDAAEIIIYIEGLTRRSFIRKMPTLSKNVRILKWSWPAAETRREMMLTAFVMGAARDVQTEWHCKIDSEAVAMDDAPWIPDDAEDHVLVGQKWGYTKAKGAALGTPASAWMLKMDYWLQAVGVGPANCMEQREEIKTYKTGKDRKGKKYTKTKLVDVIEKRYKAERDKCADGMKWNEPRICSWLCLVKTDFVQEIANRTEYRLIVPSHDTLLWWYAKRAGLPWKRDNFKKKGWQQSTRDWGRFAKMAMASPREQSDRAMGE